MKTETFFQNRHSSGNSGDEKDMCKYVLYTVIYVVYETTGQQMDLLSQDKTVLSVKAIVQMGGWCEELSED